MLDNIFQSSYLNIKGQNQNLFQINLDFTDNSTNESTPESDTSKVCEDSINSLNVKKNKNFFLQKKRNKINSENSVKKSKKKNAINELFFEFKSIGKKYKEFNKFNNIEKNVKKNFYSTTGGLASEIRIVFSSIFSSLKNFENYNKILILCENFEKIYKKYENKTMIKKCKNLNDIINKLKKEIRNTELGQIEDKSYKKNKIKKDGDLNIRKLKEGLSNKIHKLNIEQKKGILKIIKDSNSEDNLINNEIQLDINKLSVDKLLHLDKYLNECIKINNLNMSRSDLSSNKFIEEENDLDLLKNDDLSSCLSDDDEDEEE